MPHDAQFAALVAVRGIGKREALIKLPREKAVEGDSYVTSRNVQHDRFRQERSPRAKGIAP